jgi:hypothetical protein
MVGNRPVVGVRNPAYSISISSSSREKTLAWIRPNPAGNHVPITLQTVSPVRLLEAALHPE